MIRFHYLPPDYLMIYYIQYFLSKFLFTLSGDKLKNEVSRALNGHFHTKEEILFYLHKHFKKFDEQEAAKFIDELI